MKAAPPKTRTRRLTDPDAMAAVIARGKYREHLPHHQPDGEGLLVEVETPAISAAEAK